MKVLGLLPVRFNGDTPGAIVELDGSEMAMLLTGSTYEKPKTIVPGAVLKICDRVGQMQTFEERLKKGKGVGDILRAMADTIDATITGAEKALTIPVATEAAPENEA